MLLTRAYYPGKDVGQVGKPDLHAFFSCRGNTQRLADASDHFAHLASTLARWRRHWTMIRVLGIHLCKTGVIAPCGQVNALHRSTWILGSGNLGLGERTDGESDPSSRYSKREHFSHSPEPGQQLHHYLRHASTWERLQAVMVQSMLLAAYAMATYTLMKLMLTIQLLIYGTRLLHFPGPEKPRPSLIMVSSMLLVAMWLLTVMLVLLLLTIQKPILGRLWLLYRLLATISLLRLAAMAPSTSWAVVVTMV